MPKLNPSWPMETELSFIIPCHNVMRYASRLKSTVSQLAEKGRPVILVENNSGDETLQFLQDDLAAMKACVLTTDKVGAPSARNMGLEHVKTNFVKFLDADDLPILQQVSEHLDYVKSHDADFSTSLHFSAKTGSHFDVNFRLPFNNNVGQAILQGNIGVTSGAIFRKDALARVGGFSAELSSNQECDLYWRLFRTGAKYVSFPCFTFIKYLNEEGISSTVGKEEKQSNINALNEEISAYFAEEKALN